MNTSEYVPLAADALPAATAGAGTTATAWSCAQCGADGVVRTPTDIAVERIADRIREAHQHAAPGCGAGVREVRVDGRLVDRLALVALVVLAAAIGAAPTHAQTFRALPDSIAARECAELSQWDRRSDTVIVRPKQLELVPLGGRAQLRAFLCGPGTAKDVTRASRTRWVSLDTARVTVGRTTGVVTTRHETLQGRPIPVGACADAVYYALRRTYLCLWEFPPLVEPFPVRIG